MNDKFLQGPDLTNSLVGLLTRFRQEAVALVADVEAMFRQVNVVSEDRKALRFLWWPNGARSSSRRTDDDDSASIRRSLIS